MKRIIILILTLIIASIPFSSTTLAEQQAEIEFFCVKMEVIDVMNEIIAKFQEENPNIKVNLTYAAGGETVLITRVASGDVPDVMSLYPAEPTYKAFYDNGYVMDLSGQKFLDNVSEMMLNISDYNGVQFSLPYTLSTYGVFYRIDIFEELGLAVPTTTDEFIEVAKALKESGYDAVALPLADGAAQITERFLSAFDGDGWKKFQDVADGKLTIRDVPAISEYADFMLAIQPYCTPDAMGLNGNSATSDFANGVAAMRFNGAWFLSSVIEANPEAKVGMFPIPSPIMETNKVPVNIDTGFSIATDTKYPEASLMFLDFLTRPEIAQMYYEVDGNINMIKGVGYDKAEMMDLYNIVMDGNMSLTQINLWGDQPTNVRRDLSSAFQTLMMDGNVDEFYELCEAAIMDNY